MSTKILVVEDDKNINMMIQLILRYKKLDWEFQSAHDGLEALEILRHYRADLALIDLAMPKLDGAALIERIKKDSELSSCKIAVLTSVADKSIEARVKAAGVLAFWRKPITADALFSNIRDLLG